MASHAIQQQARLWHAARRSALDDVVRSDGEKQVGPAQSSAGGACTSAAGDLFFGWRGRADGSPSFGAGRWARRFTSVRNMSSLPVKPTR